MEGVFEIIRWEDDREELFEAGDYINTPHLASVLIDETVFPDEVSLDQAMQRTFQVCLHLHIPIRQHFRPVHLHSIEGHIRNDWALSDLAFYLLILNGDMQNEMSSLAQAYAIRRMFGKL